MCLPGRGVGASGWERLGVNDERTRAWNRAGTSACPYRRLGAISFAQGGKAVTRIDGFAP